VSEKLTHGWAWPLNSRKAHYFADSGVSLCGRWMFFGPINQDQQTQTSTADCPTCHKKLNKLVSRARATTPEPSHGR